LKAERPSGKSGGLGIRPIRPIRQHRHAQWPKDSPKLSPCAASASSCRSVIRLIHPLRPINPLSTGCGWRTQFRLVVDEFGANAERHRQEYEQFRESVAKVPTHFELTP
jgi:hypothetical protein